MISKFLLDILTGEDTYAIHAVPFENPWGIAFGDGHTLGGNTVGVDILVERCKAIALQHNYTIIATTPKDIFNELEDILKSAGGSETK